MVPERAAGVSVGASSSPDGCAAREPANTRAADAGSPGRPELSGVGESRLGRPQETDGARPLGGSEDHQLGQFNISEAEGKVFILLGALASEPSSGLVGLYPSPAPHQDAHTHKQTLWAMSWSWAQEAVGTWGGGLGSGAFMW